MELSKYIDQYTLIHITDQTKKEIISRIENVPIKNMSLIPDIINTYIRERLVGIDIDTVFEEWFTAVEESCSQPNEGYPFIYKNVTIGKRESSPCHWGISKSKYLDKHKQTEVISLISHLKGCVVYLSDTSREKMLGN